MVPQNVRGSMEIFFSFLLQWKFYGHSMDVFWCYFSTNLRFSQVLNPFLKLLKLVIWLILKGVHYRFFDGYLFRYGECLSAILVVCGRYCGFQAFCPNFLLFEIRSFIFIFFLLIYGLIVLSQKKKNYGLIVFVMLYMLLVLPQQLWQISWWFIEIFTL